MKNGIIVKAVPNVLGPLAKQMLQNLQKLTKNDGLRLGNREGVVWPNVESTEFIILSEPGKKLFSPRGQVLIRVEATTSDKGYAIQKAKVTVYGSWKYDLDAVKQTLSSIPSLENAKCTVITDHHEYAETFLNETYGGY